MDEAAWLRAAGYGAVSPRTNQELFDHLFEQNMQIGGREQRLESAFPEDGNLGRPGRSGFSAANVTSHVGNVLDVFELGISAWKFGRNIESSDDVRRALNDALTDMADDMVHSVFKDIEIEAFRHLFVRRQADNSQLLFSAALTCLGFIPGLGWPFAIANFVGGIIANRAQDRIRDFFEPRQNPELIEGLRILINRGYNQSFPRTGDAMTKKNRKLIQFIIRAKLLYDLRRLVDQYDPNLTTGDSEVARTNRRRMRYIHKLISLILRKETWWMHRDWVLGTSPIWFTFGERDNRTTTERPTGQFASHWVPVHFQDYFPIDCFCGGLTQFWGWFHDDLKLSVHCNQSRRTQFEIRFDNFEGHGFDNRVWAFVFRIPGINSAHFRESRRDSPDVHTETWAQNLAGKVRQIEQNLREQDNFDRAFRGVCDGIYRRCEGESVTRDSEEIPHVTSSPDGGLRAVINHQFALEQNGYLILLLTDREEEGQPRGSGDILYMRYQFIVGQVSFMEGRAPDPGPVVWDVEEQHLVRGSRRLQFRPA
jgi:hypothetical protein